VNSSKPTFNSRLHDASTGGERMVELFEVWADPDTQLIAVHLDDQSAFGTIEMTKKLIARLLATPMGSITVLSLNPKWTPVELEDTDRATLVTLLELALNELEKLTGPPPTLH
jgi:hypothetical protein